MLCKVQLDVNNLIQYHQDLSRVQHPFRSHVRKAHHFSHMDALSHWRNHLSLKASSHGRYQLRIKVLSHFIPTNLIWHVRMA